MFDELDSTPGSFSFHFKKNYERKIMRILILIFNLFALPSEGSEAIVQLDKGTIHGIREVIDGVSVDKYFGVPYAKSGYKIECWTLKDLMPFSLSYQQSFFFLKYIHSKPPINDLRFKRTVEEEAWEGVLEAQYMRPLCAQAMNCSGCEGYEISEDCLYLNIFGPSDTSQKLPGKRSIMAHGP